MSLMEKLAIRLDKVNSYKLLILKIMTIKLMQGQFNNIDAIDLITKMVHAKIKFQEEKISHASNEEDIKMREKRIKQLQKDLFEARTFIEQSPQQIYLDAEIALS